MKYLVQSHVEYVSVFCKSSLTLQLEFLQCLLLAESTLLAEG
uniref:Uncharacterized protein n=1 Tax=Arundo donax TaxID=35708 RepID=A0A0A9H6Y7_ARUDO